MAFCKEKEQFVCPALPPSELFNKSEWVLMEQVAEDLAAGEAQLEGYKSLSRGEAVVGPLHLQGVL